MDSGNMPEYRCKVYISHEPFKVPACIASYEILGHGSTFGSAYVGPDVLGNAKTCSTRRRRFVVFSDGTGKLPIQPEWKSQGVTVVGRRTGGRNEDKYVKYEFTAGLMD